MPSPMMASVWVATTIAVEADPTVGVRSHDLRSWARVAVAMSGCYLMPICAAAASTPLELQTDAGGDLAIEHRPAET